MASPPIAVAMRVRVYVIASIDEPSVLRREDALIVVPGTVRRPASALIACESTIHSEHRKTAVAAPPARLPFARCGARNT